MRRYILIHMKDNKNYKWTKKDLAQQYKYENPDWTWKQCWDKANIIYRELKKLNKETWDNTKIFFKHNTPFSFFDNKDSEFADKPWSGGLD